MARWRRLLAAALVASAISSGATVQAQEEVESARPVSIDQIPAPARDAILSQVGSGTLSEVLEATGQSGEPMYVGRINLGEAQGHRVGRRGGEPPRDTPRQLRFTLGVSQRRGFLAMRIARVSACTRAAT